MVLIVNLGLLKLFIFVNKKYSSNVLFTNRFGDRWSKQSIEKMVKTIASKANVGIVIDIYDAITS
jgi:site-specific recombinase XerD